MPEGLARALVVAGKLTSYQAAALSQGKARGLLIGNYFILDKLGAGGMGVVFKARHRRLGRVVALKILPPSLARNPDLFLRFRREVDVAAKLSHPNIVSVLDADDDRGVQFMTMEYIQGKDLDRLVRDHGVLPADQALDCVIQAARGLEAAPNDEALVTLAMRCPSEQRALVAGSRTRAAMDSVAARHPGSRLALGLEQAVRDR